MTGGSEMGDNSGTAVAAQPRPEVIVRTVREVSGTDNEEDDMSALEAISVVGRLTVGQQVVSEPYKRRRHSDRWRGQAVWSWAMAVALS